MTFILMASNSFNSEIFSSRLKNCDALHYGRKTTRIMYFIPNVLGSNYLLFRYVFFNYFFMIIWIDFLKNAVS